MKLYTKVPGQDDFVINPRIIPRELKALMDTAEMAFELGNKIINNTTDNEPSSIDKLVDMFADTLGDNKDKYGSV